MNMENSDVKVNFLAGVGVVETSIEKLIRDSERLAAVKNYVESTIYPDRSTMLVMMGEKTEKEQ